MIDRQFGICVWLGLIPFLVTETWAQLPSGWKAHDMHRETPEIVEPSDPSEPVEPPRDAVVLFDGSDLDQFCDSDGNDATWVMEGGVLESVPGSGYLFTKQAFGDVQLHLEWAAPAKVEGNGQGRGNSGVFLMGRYEIQILDCFDNPTYADGYAGAIYGQYPPLVNASRRPGEWQTYDIIFHRPRFRSSGELDRAATITLIHNGVLVQDHVELWGPTAWMKHEAYQSHPDKLPLSFQDHGNPVRYRNIWVRELPEPRLSPPLPGTYTSEVIQLSRQQMENLEGDYGGIRLETENDQLYLVRNDRRFEIVTHSESEWSLRYTAAEIYVEYDELGNPQQITYTMGGAEETGERSSDANDEPVDR